MNTKTLTEIDFFRIRDEIAACCVSVEGKNNLLKREPLTKTDKIEFNLNKDYVFNKAKKIELNQNLEKNIEKPPEHRIKKAQEKAERCSAFFSK